MRWLLFLSRIAFICNVCFLLAFSIQLSNWITNEDLKSTIVLIGYIMGFVINPLTNLCYLVLALFARPRLQIVPAWLITANVIFLCLQVLYILYLNQTPTP